MEKLVFTNGCFDIIHTSHVDLLPLRYKAVVYSSEVLRKISKVFKPLTKVADSVYLEFINQKYE